MKLVASIAAISFSTLHLHAQAVVNFANNSVTAVTNRLTGQRVAVGNGYLAQLFYAPSNTAPENLESAMTALGASVGFAPLPGLYAGGVRVTPSTTAPGAGAYFQVRAWQASLGSDYETARQAWLGDATGTKVLGHSSVMLVRQTGVPPFTPGAVLADWGLKGFYLEPHSGATLSIMCPPDMGATNDSGQCSAAVNYAAPAVNPPSATVQCTPASGAAFARGVNTVECTATDAHGNRVRCSFRVTVRDTEAPRVACRPTTNPGGSIPAAGENPKSNGNPDGYFQVFAKDNCDPDPKIFIKDSASSFVAGPFAGGTKLKINQGQSGTPSQRTGPGGVIHIRVNGDALISATDADANSSAPVRCQ